MLSNVCRLLIFFICLYISVICQSVKYSTSIRNIDFTGCNITWRGAEHMASIINVEGFIPFVHSFCIYWNCSWLEIVCPFDNIFSASGSTQARSSLGRVSEVPASAVWRHGRSPSYHPQLQHVDRWSRRCLSGQRADGRPLGKRSERNMMRTRVWGCCPSCEVVKFPSVLWLVNSCGPPEMRTVHRGGSALARGLED